MTTRSPRDRDVFALWGKLVANHRFLVLGIVAVAMLSLGGYAWGFEDRLSAGGLDDPNSESARAAVMAADAFGPNHAVDVVVLYTAPDGKTVDDPDVSAPVIDSLNGLTHRFPNEIAGVNGTYWSAVNTIKGSSAMAATKDKTRAIAAIALKGEDGTELARDYATVKDAFAIPGIEVHVGGLQPVSSALTDTISADTHRMELLAIPAVAVLLFFIFGGVVAAALPLMMGVLTILGANGVVRSITNITEVNSFVAPVVSMIGLGLAIDYALFIVSRFREEVAAGYDTPAAVRRSVMTAGRTVLFSATMIVASLGGMLLFPQGFLKSIAYGAIATVTLAALTAVTILPAMLAILGPWVDALGIKRFRRTDSAHDVEQGFWGRSTTWVMRHPREITAVLVLGLLMLIVPVRNIAFGGFSEKYLPPDNTTRVAQQQIDTYFPLRKSDPIELLIVAGDSTEVGPLIEQASHAPGLLSAGFEVPTRSQSQPNIYRTQAYLIDSTDYDKTIDYLRALPVPDDMTVLVGGVPTIQHDAIAALLNRLPLMILLVLAVTTLLMFLTFGSLVLPIKAAFMSVLGLGSTLGILTWIFTEGHGATLLNFTPQPIQANILFLIIAIVYGLSTDYEVFLLSRMVEARARGATTEEAIRSGTAHTGRIITAAALILLVVTGAFAFSDLVLMQYIAYGMIAALLIDATVLRMLLVPATMKLLGDRVWWAPAWMKRIQRRIGLSEPVLRDEPDHLRRTEFADARS
ncbi:MMPL family transporter [Nocardia aurantiaca]|uniref:MMPL family transporter n=1 Tax=Nocardia aurantiaca TaxID=2675850 RepID=A0A6I3L3Y9_9NOCA|nr:MMPL family transporter [Nocardia aurantiaca]MTE14599.1 MMPL family transporter [Nocardia aurantiaca]